MKITYYLRTSKTDKKGLAPIYAKIYAPTGELNKSTGIKCTPAKWCTKTQCVKDFTLSIQLEKYKKSIDTIEVLEPLKKTKTNKALKEALAQFEIWNNLKQKTKGTKKGDASRMAILSTFLLDNENYYSPTDLDSNTANRYVNFLINRFDYKASSLNRQNKFLKMFVKFCFEQGLVTKNIIQIVAKTSKPKHIQHLSSTEVDRLRHVSLCHRLEKVRDLFIFAINTGLAHCDLIKIDRTYIFTTEKGIRHIRICRNKTKTECVIPLNAEALEFLRKYNYALPKLSYDKYNKYLKEVGELAGVETKITTHTARRTCGMILLNKNMGYDMVAKILGHSDIKTTKDYYARYMNDTIFDAYFKAMG